MKFIFCFLLTTFLCFSAKTQTVILQENFNSGIPASWTVVNNDGFTVANDPAVNFVTDAWVAAAAMEIDSINDLDLYSTSWYTPTGVADDWLITPQITLGAYGNYLRWQARSEDESYPDGYKVLVSKAGNQLTDFTDTLFITGGEIPEWQDRNVSLDSSGLTNEAIYIAFVNNSNDKFLLLLDNISVEINNPVSVSEHKAPKLAVFPNPAHDRVFINTNLSQQIEILDLSGKIMHLGRVDTFTKTIDISAWSKGIYLVRVIDSEFSVTQKLVVQ
ncbi:MAG: choice-of-anchor J domain-containing protein [Flavobacteriales bacterium]